MLSSYSLRAIFQGQLRAVRGTGGKLEPICRIAFFFGLPALSPIIQACLKLHVDKDIVSIIVSAASIFAGLLLNLLVIIYGIAPSPDAPVRDRKARDDLLKVIEIAFYNISYAIACSLILVVFSLITLTGIKGLTSFAELFVYYLGVHLLLCVILVLRQCHGLMEFRLTKSGTIRSDQANDTWK